MKFLKRIRARLNSFLSPQPGKTGSSMAFVMIIGAVLVIWVLAIMPLMVAVGNNSLLTQGSYADYLQSRSAIEFCKGELEKIVETKPPYTFCVVKNDNDTYSPIPKLESNSLADAYKAVIDYDQNDDAKDKPLTDANNVVAICAVSQDNNAENVYHITITTYNNGKKNLTYTADYTIRGSLLINPESYLKSQALPLSDFVVVDGKLGSNTLWDSTIHSLSFSTKDSDNVTNLYAIHENFKPYISTALPGSGYADSGVFPSVFKTPVYPAGGGIEVPGETRPTEPEITVDNNVGLIRPNAVAFDKESKALGDIYYKHAPEIINGQYTDIIKIYAIDSNGNEVDITEQCVIYLNGKEFDKDDTNAIKPEAIYQVSIDFEGTDSILAVNGLVMPELIGQPNAVHPQSAPTGITLSVSGNTVTLTEMDKVVYGYIYADEPTTVHWDTSGSNVLTIDSSKTCFFYAYYPYRIEGDVVYTASPATYIGTVYPLVLATELTNGKEYVIYSSGHALKNENGAPGAFAFTNADDYRAGSVPSNLKWTAVASNNAYQFMNGSSNLAMPFSDNKFTLTIRSDGDYGKFTISKDSADNTAFYVSQTNDGGCGPDVTGYLTYTNNKFTVSNTKSIIYFYKIPKQVTHPNASDIVTENITPADAEVPYGQKYSDIDAYRDYPDLSANGEKVNTNATPDAGIYEMTTEVGGKTYYLGVLTVKKASLDNKPAVTESHNKHNVTVTITNKNIGYGVVRWIGYKPTDGGDYKWFPADYNDSYTFELPYGTYDFVAYETGSLNYEPVMSDPVQISLTAPVEEAPGGGEEGGSGDGYSEASMMMGSSLYFMGRDGSIMTEGTTIYLTTDLLVMRHGIVGDGEVYIYPYSNEQNYDESAADTLFFPVNTMRNAAGFEFKACTFYWIPAGTDINHATAEDLNFDKRPPLSLDNDEEYDRLKILLRKGDYPDINMDVAYIDRENKADKVNANGTPNNEQLAHIVSGETIGWTVNGELVNGNDKNYGNSNNGFDSTNRQFVVCAYISKVNDTTIARTANRILIASEETDANGIKSFSLSVPNSVTFTCRYFSVYANSIVQTTNRGALKIVNLGRDSSFIEAIKTAIGFSKYDSRSLQIDFELYTDVYYSDGGSNLSYSCPAGIYRIEPPTNPGSINLFSEYELKPLMVTYTNTEIKGWLNGASNDIRLVDRYMTLTAGSDPDLSLKAIGDSNLEVFSNYVFVDKSVTSYTFSTYWLAGALGAETDFLINSQERGYKSEYLGFFTQNSAESYNGTILYIAPDDSNKELGVGNGGITIIQKTTSLIFGSSETRTEIPSGFYYIPACEDGTSITELALLTNDPNNAYFYGDNPNDDTSTYRINPADLPKYSIYIKEDGTLSDAYVDTGLIGNSNLGESGFSGGNVG